MKYRHCLAFLFTTTLSLSGCSAGYTAGYTGRTADSSTIVIGLSTAPVTLDFTRTASASIPEALMGNVYEGLVRIDNDGTIQPWLATSWDIDPTRTIYTFHLRQDVTFSNGAPFNAESAEFSLQRVKSDAWTNGNKSLMQPIESTRIIDPYTLEVTLNKPSQQWLWALGLFPGAMMSPTGIDTLATNPIGTGPYTVENFAPGLSINLAVNPTYWGEKPSNSGVTLRYYNSATGAANALESGDIDIVYGLQSPELIDRLQAHDKYAVTVGSTNGELLLTMNNQRAPFNDIRVRQAVLYGINRQDIIDTAWYGYGLDTGGSPTAPTDPWHITYTRYPYDLERAQNLLKEANAVGTKITLSVPSRPYATAAAEILISQLRDIGFDPHIESTEFPAVWLQKVYRNKDYDMSLIVHAEARDITTIFGNPNYYLGYDNERVREYFALADQSDYPTMIENMHKAIDLIMDDAPADNLFNFPNIVVSAPGVTGISASSPTSTLVVSSIHRNNDS